MSDGSGGYLLALLTDSFIVRAMIGTLAALLLALLTIRLVPIRSALARRVLVLAPVVTAAVAAVASVGGQFVPTIMVMNGGQVATEGGALEVLGETRQMTEARSVGYLVLLWLVIASVLLSRRVVGAVRVRALLRRAPVAGRGDRSARALRRVAREMVVRPPELRLVSGCPGGAFTVGRRTARIALDPELAASLDDDELRGLLAHELAHVRRGDPLTGLLVGIVRDLAFFLPGIHIAARWLGVEQEHSADELAAESTQRPGALASGLLKAWHSAGADGARSHLPAGACAAAAGGWGHRRRFAQLWQLWSERSPGQLMAAVVPAGVSPWSSADPLTSITQRIERLIAAAPSVSTGRRRAETVAALAVTVLAALTAVVAPAWFSHRHADLVGFFYLSTAQTVEVESPAMTTFRALAGASPPATVGQVEETSRAAGVATPASGDPAASARQESAAACPCIPSPSQLAAAQSASPAERTGTAWGSQGWTLQSLRHQSQLEATRRLLLMDNAQQQVGFLTAGRSLPGARSSDADVADAVNGAPTATAAGSSSHRASR